ncbi:TonB-dependent receptor domain-containing protein [Neisseria bacilliformis]|uniref:TonB-dependent receptor domain-containing protein n=1 Tax=Neisseria bacilliformis TaxID=267212 RepID=UPI0028EC8F17|nr:TonB-dependent receptor [Neisseria bacilliformis]
MSASSLPVRLSLLTLALAAGFAHAEDPAAAEGSLETVTVKGANLSTHRITTQKIDESTDTDLKELLFSEPSIGFGGGNGTSQWVNIRGLGQDQIDFKVDDAYMDTSTFHHQSRFLLDPSLVKVVAVQKGSGSASAGIGASSGAIVAETVDPADLLRPDQNFGFKVNAGVSGNKGRNRGISAYGRAGGFDGLVVGSWNTEKDYKAGKGYTNPGVTGGNRVPFSALGERGLLAKIGYSFNPDNRVELSRRQEKTYGQRTMREEFVDFGRNPASYRRYTQDTTNLEYRGADLGFVSKIKTNVYQMQTKREDGDDGAVKSKATGANLNLDSLIFDKHTLKYGVNWRKEKNYPKDNNSGAANENKTDYGLYLEGIWDFHPVTLTTGLRYDHFKVNTTGHTSASKGNVNPSLGIIYDPLDNLSLRASLNYATRSPRLYEAMLANARNIVVDPDLKAERSRTTEIGFNYRPIRDLSLTGSYFWQHISNVHDFVCLSGGCVGVRATYRSGITRSTNNGYIKNKGYEFGANYRWRGLTARMGVAYSDPKHHAEKESYDLNTKAHAVGRTWTAGLAYRFDKPNLEIGWRGRFVQARTGTPDRGASANTTERRAGYGVNDIYANWKPTGKDNLNINFAINNVGNKYYYSHSQRSSSSSGNSLPEVGRDVRFAVNYKF